MRSNRRSECRRELRWFARGAEREFVREMQLRLKRTPNLETRSSSSSICPRRRAIACRSAHTFAMHVWRVAVAERSKRLNTECTEAEHRVHREKGDSDHLGG